MTAPEMYISLGTALLLAGNTVLIRWQGLRSKRHDERSDIRAGEVKADVKRVSAETTERLVVIHELVNSNMDAVKKRVGELEAEVATLEAEIRELKAMY
jgi:hypothetical protein